jgi:hypothetical protein
MSIINISKEDIERGKPWEPGWHKVRFVAVTDAPSKDAQSINYKLVFELLDGSKRTGEWACSFNSKMPGFSIPFFAAMMGSAALEPGSYDFNKYLNGELWIEMGKEPYNGTLQDKVKGFAHKDTAPAF